MQQRGDESAAAVHVVYLPDEIIAEILVLLPGDSVLCARAVSRAWRRITTDPAFLAAHARRRPLELILRTTVVTTARHLGDYRDDVVALDTIPVSAAADEAGPPRRLVRYPYWNDGVMQLVASCDGVLLFKNGRGMYLACNPVTRQWAKLPQLTERGNRLVLDYGFYHHEPSGEHRLLCRCIVGRAPQREIVYYVLSTAATEPRRLVIVADADDAAARAITPPYSWRRCPCAAAHGRLYWLSQRDALHPSRGRRMVAFDTASETFHMMTLPPTLSRAERVDIFAMDGQLVTAEFGEKQIDLWFLEDYDGGANGQWERRHRIDTAPIHTQLRLRARVPLFRDSSQWLHVDGDIAVAGTDEGDIVLRAVDGVVVHNVKTNTSRVIADRAAQAPSLPLLVYRESLVQHQRFKAWSPQALPWMKFS